VSFATARLSAEPVTPADRPFLAALWSDERVVRTLGGPRSPGQVERTLGEEVRHWQVHGFGRWIIRRAGLPLGTVRLNTCQVRGRAEVELGYALLPGAWGQGYATEAGAGALSFARDVAALTEVIAGALKSNAASLAVMERLGFMRESQLDLPAGPHWLYRKNLAEALFRPNGAGGPWSSRPGPSRGSRPGWGGSSRTRTCRPRAA
jgi:RimJ/RimL family protein N-acetyltransferase